MADSAKPVSSPASRPPLPPGQELGGAASAPRPVVPAKPEEPQKRPPHEVLGDIDSIINTLEHTSPSGLQTAVAQLRGHLREMREHVK